MRHKPVAKLSRSIGIALTPKAQKYLDRRPHPPGANRNRRPNGPYKERLMEKQRLRLQYHVSETQLRRSFEIARSQGTRTGDALLELLERRLDALVLRSGFATTIYQARQFVSHGHVHVDGKRVDRPSYKVHPGQTLAIAPKSRQRVIFQAIAQHPSTENVPRYLTVDHGGMTSVFERIPARDEIPVLCDERLVVEYYARK